MKRMFLLTSLVLLTAAPAFGQIDKEQKKQLEEYFKQQKGKYFIVKVPMKLYQYEKEALAGPSIYYFGIRQSESGLSIDGYREWVTAGFPVMALQRFEKIRFTKEYTEIELRSVAIYLKLRFQPSVRDIKQAFSDLTYFGSVASFENSEYFKTEVYAVQEPIVFRGPLAGLPSEAKLRLLRKISYVTKNIDTETYKEKSYFTRDYGSFSSAFNTIRMNQSARISHVLKDKLLEEMKDYQKIFSDHAGLDGMKLKITLSYYNFVTKKDGGTDHVEIYTTFDLIKKFAEADITSQDLVDGSIVLVDGNRVKVNLEQSTS